MRKARVVGIVLGCAATVPAAAAITPADLQLVQWPDSATTFSQPIGIRSAGDGSGRVFVIERCSGIRIVKDGTLLATPFVSIANSCGGEQGVLGLAFDPDYAVNGTFYVSYSAPSSDPRLGDTADHVLARYRVSDGDPDIADPDGEVLLRVPDIASNHNGGDLHFDHQGYLNWSIGDGGVQGDPNGFAQCTGRKKADNDPGSCHSTDGSGPTYYLLGKIVRLDVHATTASAPANFCGATPGQPAPYAIPPGNPFVDAGAHPQECAEIFNWGFRNPFRFSIDRQTGDMLIGDVGQNAYEEVSFQAAGSPGQNFQWNQCEGFHSYPGGAPTCAGPAGSLPPKLDYSHSVGCAVTGGNVYRGPIEPLRGQYLFSDSCSGAIYVVADAGADVSPWTWEVLPDTPPMSTYSFGEDDEGNLYVADGGGKVYRFQSESSGDVIFQDGFD
ncbi:PQQ-dependent sugar dehydrogenase [Dokdonella ginsengisoli]|uniref:PQQ-dependent sugar dehydrogenase n=1 Tax=Dokdonella ginsengisoli TaxID=363846 RepID=A0ABV9QNU8_9GAMM